MCFGLCAETLTNVESILFHPWIFIKISLFTSCHNSFFIHYSLQVDSNAIFVLMPLLFTRSFMWPSKLVLVGETMSVMLEHASSVSN